MLDVGFIAYDLYDIGKSIINGKQVTSTQIGALITDVACAATPFVVGGGLAVRAASKSDDVAKVANNAISKEVSKESVKSFKSVENLIESAGKLERLKGGVHQVSVKGNPIEIFTNLAKQYGAKIESNGSNKYFFKSGKVRVDFYNSYTKGTPTIHIDNNGQLTKIRVTQW